MKNEERRRVLQETAQRIVNLRRLLGKNRFSLRKMSQELFAKHLGVKPAAVAGWERAERRYAPGPRALGKLVKASLDAGSLEDALFFSRCAGWDIDVVVSFAKLVLVKRQQIPEDGEINRIPETERLQEGGYGLVGVKEFQPSSPPGIVLSARFVRGSQPQAYVLDKGFGGSKFFGAGDRIFIDWSLGFGEGIESLWGQPVLLEFEPLGSAGRVSDYSLHLGLFLKEPGPAGRSQAVLLQPFGEKLIVGISNSDGELAMLPGVKILGRAFGWLSSPITTTQIPARKAEGEKVNSRAKPMRKGSSR